MNADVAPGKSSASDVADRHSIYDSFPYFVGGGVLGAVAAFFAAMACGLMLAFANAFAGGELCGAGLSTSVIALLAVLAGVITIACGAWLFNLRKGIGASAAPEDFAHSKRLRLRFAISSMTVYCLLAPAVWVVAAASANCTGS